MRRKLVVVQLVSLILVNLLARLVAADFPEHTYDIAWIVGGISMWTLEIQIREIFIYKVFDK